MTPAVIVFPGSNCDRDVAVALQAVSGKPPAMVWHGDAQIPDVDLIVLPGGFSFGDYLRSGAMAAHSPVMRDVVAKAKAGTPVLGICNGFQILTESGLLPGALMRNASLKFICRDVFLRVEQGNTLFDNAFEKNQIIKIPVANHDGNYYTDDDTLSRLEGDGRIAFRYCDRQGTAALDSNPNGSRNNIAGIYDETRKILGLMPHPERLADEALGGTDGKGFFTSLINSLN